MQKIIKKNAVYFIMIIVVMVAIIISKFINSDTGKEKKYQREIFAMDTVMTLTAYGKESKKAVDAAVDEINKLDNTFSTGKNDSDISKINSKKTSKVSKDTMKLILKSFDIYRDTNGDFDITIYPVVREWGFYTGKYRVPQKSELKELLKNVAQDSVKCNENDMTVTVPENVEIDLGGIAKGYTSERVTEILKKYNITGGIISLGGNVQTCGKKSSSSNWIVAVKNPDADIFQSDYLGTLNIGEKAVITSGGYERFFEKNGKKYHHIIDPKTGMPAESDLLSVTIVSDNGTIADGLSTSLFIMGEDDAIKYWKKNKKKFDMILAKKDGTVVVTKGIEKKFTTEIPCSVVN